MGKKLRRQRVRLALTLDDLAARTGISKPYLSLIETGRVPNPPSDEKLRRLEGALQFTPGELVSQAHLQRTPRDVRAVLQKLLSRRDGRKRAKEESPPKSGSSENPANAPPPDNPAAVNLDDAYLSGILQDLVEKSAGNVEPIPTNSVPVINRVSAGYPRDFTDLSYPPSVADAYVSCPDLADNNAFAARVHGDSMMPKYHEGEIVIFSPAVDPASGDDCFVRFADGHTTFKRIFFEQDEQKRDVIRLQPRNERYRPQVVPADQITGLYKAVFRYQKVNED